MFLKSPLLCKADVPNHFLRQTDCCIVFVSRKTVMASLLTVPQGDHSRDSSATDSVALLVEQAVAPATLSGEL